MINSSYFSNIIMLVILMNAVTIALEAEYSLNPDESANRVLNILDIFDYIFFVIYFVEFLLKLYVYQVAFWKNASYVFELLILIIMLIQIIIAGGGMRKDDGSKVIVDILNIFKAVRIFRAVILFEGVQVLLNALLNTVLKSAGNVSVLLIMLWMFFAVVGYYSFGYDDDAEVYEDWGTLSNAIISLLTYLFAEGWVQIQKMLNDKFPGSEFYAIIFIAFAHFIFINLFIGIIIMNIHDATERYSEAQRKEREMQLQLKKEYLYKRQHDDVHKMMEKQKHHQYDNFAEMTRSFFETLSNDDYVLMNDISTNLMWLETFIDSLQRLDMYTYRAQQCHRNISVVLAEMAERHYKQQYGLSLPNEFANTTTFDPYNQQKTSPNKSAHGDLEKRNSDDENGDAGQCSSKETVESNESTGPFSTTDFMKRFSDGFPDENNVGEPVTTGVRFSLPRSVSAFAGDSPQRTTKAVITPRRGTVGTLVLPTIIIDDEIDEEDEEEYDDDDIDVGETIDNGYDISVPELGIPNS